MTVKEPRVKTLFAGLACTLLAATTASAQTTFEPERDPRVYVAANVIFQPSSNGLNETFEFQEFVEPGTITTSFEPGDAIGFDGGLTVRLWNRLGVSAAVSTYTPDKGGTVSARIPHPLYFDQHREISGAADLTRSETAIHANLAYIVPAGERVLAIVSAGASYFRVEQDFVNDVQYSQEYPFDTAEFRGVDRDRESGSAVGFNATLDVAWRFSRSFSVGGLVRYAQASVPFTPGDRGEVTIDVGGVQAGLGLRVNF